MTGGEIASQTGELPEWTRKVGPDLLREYLASGLRPLEIPGAWAREVPVEERRMTVSQVIDYHRGEAKRVGLETPLGLLHGLLASHIEGAFRVR